MSELIIDSPVALDAAAGSSIKADPALSGAVEFTSGMAGRHVLPALGAPIYVSAGTPDGTVVYQSDIIRPAEGTGGVIRAGSEPTDALYSNNRFNYVGGGHELPTGVPGLSYVIVLLYPDGSLSATVAGPIGLTPGTLYSTGMGYAIQLVKTGPAANGTVAAGTLFQLVAGSARTLLSEFLLTSAITVVVTA
ncbi:hypothetical protein [Pseudomonas sp. TE3610]